MHNLRLNIIPPQLFFDLSRICQNLSTIQSKIPSDFMFSYVLFCDGEPVCSPNLGSFHSFTPQETFLIDEFIDFPLADRVLPHASVVEIALWISTGPSKITPLFVGSIPLFTKRGNYRIGIKQLPLIPVIDYQTLSEVTQLSLICVCDWFGAELALLENQLINGNRKSLEDIFNLNNFITQKHELSLIHPSLHYTKLQEYLENAQFLRISQAVIQGKGKGVGPVRMLIPPVGWMDTVASGAMQQMEKEIPKSQYQAVILEIEFLSYPAGHRKAIDSEIDTDQLLIEPSSHLPQLQIPSFGTEQEEKGRFQRDQIGSSIIQHIDTLGIGAYQ
ncbi:MAG: hypothetical protein EZS28_003981 [Streblomastix strix]|uniref:C2 PI3K-type domain-containing protein n=1 Tax=Streblomastix strix TaxID=222440 RepID=A0A5J4WZP8_9EUKA|nr:MAG: hypothetical protein EZS28_003981 [Streblomastix strix]